MGEALGNNREKTESTVVGQDGRVRTRVWDAIRWPGVRGEQFRFDVPKNGEDWMVIDGWAVEKKKKPEFRKVLVRMDHPFVKHIRRYVEEDPEPGKPLFRQWSRGTWYALIRKQLPRFFFHYFRSACITNSIREGMGPGKVSRMIDVDISHVMNPYFLMLDEEAALSRPRNA